MPQNAVFADLTPLHHDGGGGFDGATVALIIAVAVVLGLIGFAIWALQQRKDLEP